MSSPANPELAFLHPIEADALNDKVKNEQLHAGYSSADPDLSHYFESTTLHAPGTDIADIFEWIRRATQLYPQQQRAALDLAGGPAGRAIRQLSTDYDVPNALYTTWFDTRSPSAKTAAGPDLITGDLRTSEPWHAIDAWRHARARTNDNLPPDFNVIIHRPVSSLQHFQPSVYEGAAHWLTDRLAPGGIAILQVPRAIDAQLDKPNGTAICEGLQDRSDVSRLGQMVHTTQSVRHGLGYLVVEKALSSN